MKTIFSFIVGGKLESFEPNQANSEGQSYLHYYAAKGNLDGIEVLLIAGANVNMPDNFGMTPTHHAAFNGHLPAVRKLFNAGANLYARTNDGRSAAELALEAKHELVAAYIRKCSRRYP